MISSKALAVCMAAAMALVSSHVFADFTFRYPSSVQFKTGVAGGHESNEPQEPVVSPEEALAEWEQFALDNGMTVTAGWNGLQGTGNAANPIPLTMPRSPFPNPNPSGQIYLTGYAIDSLAGFSHIASTGGPLIIMNGSIASIDGGFSRLVTAYYINLEGFDVCMPSLTSAYILQTASTNLATCYPKLDDLTMLSARNITDMRPLLKYTMLEMVTVADDVALRPGFVPLPSDSWLCQPEKESVLSQQAQVCSP